MQNYYSNGKLLITGEYVVLDGAEALAVPTKFGQSLSVEPLSRPQILWKSLDAEGESWFEACLQLDALDSYTEKPQAPIWNRLIQILQAAKSLNPEFLQSQQGYTICTKLDFPRTWGLGSSSTLLNNIAQWAQIDVFTLSNATFGGSAYDVACASHNSPIIYTLEAEGPQIRTISFEPNFSSELFFIHLNSKQNSRDGIKAYETQKQDVLATVEKINKITSDICTCKDRKAFDLLIHKHEALIGQITGQIPIQQLMFKDYPHAIKSLGAWGGDFILATGQSKELRSYFEARGYQTIIPFQDMLL